MFVRIAEEEFGWKAKLHIVQVSGNMLVLLLCGLAAVTVLTAAMLNYKSAAFFLE